MRYRLARRFIAFIGPNSLFELNKGFPSDGKEHPSRSTTWQEVTMVMRMIFGKKLKRANEILGWPSRIMRFTRVLGGILSFALLYNPIQAFSATAPAGKSVTLTWNLNTDPNVVGNNVYYGVSSHNYTNAINAGNVTNTTISGLVAGVTYYFAATAYDSTGAQSGYSTEVTYSVPTAVQTNVPAGQGTTLTWSPNTDPAVVGNNVYYGVASHTYTNMINVGNATSATIPGLVEGVTYYFAAKAYDSTGAQSDYSIEAIYTVPTMLSQMRIRHASSAGQFTLTVTGPVGRTYDILATQDLKAWTVIGTVTVGASGSLDFTDTNAANFSKRFYRTRQNP